MSADGAGLKAGKQTFEVSCSACHGTKGEGIAEGVPAFAGNSQIRDQQADRDAYQRGEDIADHRRPGLRQRAVRHREKQHRGRPEGRDKVKPESRVNRRGQHEQASEAQPDKGADPGPD